MVALSDADASNYQALFQYTKSVKPGTGFRAKLTVIRRKYHRYDRLGE